MQIGLFYNEPVRRLLQHMERPFGEVRVFPQWQALKMECVRLLSGRRVPLFVMTALLRFTIYHEQGE